MLALVLSSSALVFEMSRLGILEPFCRPVMAAWGRGLCSLEGESNGKMFSVAGDSGDEAGLK